MTLPTLDPTSHPFTGRREWGLNVADDQRCVVCGIQKQAHPTGTGPTDRDRLVEVIRATDTDMDIWDATKLAEAIVAAGVTGPGDEKYLPYHLNELGTEVHGLRDALWHASRALGLDLPPAPDVVTRSDRGPLSNRVATMAAVVKHCQDMAHKVRGRLP